MTQVLRLGKLRRLATHFEKDINRRNQFGRSVILIVVALCHLIAIVTVHSATPVLPAPARGVTVAGDIAYLSAGAQGLILLDVRDPKQPRHLGRFATGGEAWSVAITNHLAFVANGPGGMVVLDVSAPSNPTLVGSLPLPGNIVSVALKGSHAYLADIWLGMRVVDISRPDRPLAVGLASREKFNSVVAGPRYVYVAENVVGLFTIDASNPGAPEIVTRYGDFAKDMARWIALDGNQLYAALDHSGLAVFELPESGIPVWKGQCNLASFANYVSVANGYAYVTCGLDGFSIIDIRDPSTPRPQSAFPTPTPGSASGVAIKGNYALIADAWAGLQVYDVADPLRPAWASVYHTGLEPKGLTVTSNRIYSAGGDGLQIWSVEKNTRPQILGEFRARETVKSIAVAGRFAFLAEGLSGFQAVDAGVAPVVAVADVSTGGEANDLAVSGNFLFLANGPSGFTVYDISNLPGVSPRKIANIPTAASINGVTLDGSHAVLAAGKEGLIIIDVSNPAAPKVVSRHDTSGDARGVALSGNHAFIADGWAGVEMVDLTDRTRPRRAGGFETGGFAMRVAARERTVYLADSFALRAIDFRFPAAPWVHAEYKNVPALNVAVGENAIFAVTQTNSIASLTIESPVTLSPAVNATNFTGVRVSGPPGAWIKVQSSTNLTEWIDRQTIVLDANGASVAAATAKESARFYRAFSGPGPGDTTNREIPQVILDSDIGGDSDDILDLVLLHKFADMGLCNIVGVTFSVDIPYGAPALEAINIAYGRPDIPVASTKGHLVPATDCFAQYVVENFPNTMRHDTNAPDSVRWYREILAKAPPRSLTIIEGSVIVSLYDLMFSGPDDLSPLTGEELLNEKVKLLAVVAGDYPSGTEFYFRYAPQLSAPLVHRLKCPIVFTGEALGFYVTTAHLSQLQQLVPSGSILRSAYEEYYRFVRGTFRYAWSQPLIWHLIAGPSAGGRTLFDVERGGYNFVSDFGGNTMRTDAVGKSQSYLALKAPEADVVAAITSVAYLPPGVLPRPYDPHVNLFAQLVQSNGGTVSETALKALDEYVKALKADGTWDRKEIIWPCVGDNMNAALCLLKHPLTTSGVLRPVGKLPSSFIQGQGLVGDGQFSLDTGIPPWVVKMRTDSAHLSVYSQTEASGNDLVECGRYEGSEQAVELILRFGAGHPNPIFDSGSVTQGRVTASRSYPTTGYFIGNRTAFGASSLYRDRVLIGAASASGGRMPGGSLMIYSAHEIVTNSVRTLSHFSCGPHLTPSQLITDAVATEKLQRALGRSVNP